MQLTYLMRRANNLKVKIISYFRKRCNYMKLKNKNFTIISNNCWGGDVYQMYGLEYTSPTIGLYLYESDYVKFVANLEKYLSQELTFIQPEQSRFYVKLCQEFGAEKLGFPIAKILDVEIMFLHYKSIDEAKKKWERRKKRINYSNILFKLSDRTDCNEDIIRAFCDLPYKNKICFTKKEYPDLECTVFVDALNNLPNGITEKDSTLKHIDITDLLNHMNEKQ